MRTDVVQPLATVRNQHTLANTLRSSRTTRKESNHNARSLIRSAKDHLLNYIKLLIAKFLHEATEQNTNNQATTKEYSNILVGTY